MSLFNDILCILLQVISSTPAIIIVLIARLLQFLNYLTTLKYALLEPPPLPHIHFLAMLSTSSEINAPSSNGPSKYQFSVTVPP